VRGERAEVPPGINLAMTKTMDGVVMVDMHHLVQIDGVF
jgi:hypothetical protein